MTVITETTALIVGTDTTGGIVGIASAIPGILTGVFLTTITEIIGVGIILTTLFTETVGIAGTAMADLVVVIQATTALRLGVPELHTIQ